MSIIPFVDTAVNSLTSIYNTNKTIKAQKNLADYSYQKDLEMWNKANEYNSPGQQMQRLESAGLNPNLVYGSGSVAGNTSTQTPKYQMYDTTYRYQAPRVSEVLNTLSQYQDYKYKKAQSEGARLDNVDKAVRNANNQDFYLGRASKMYAGGINESAKNIGLPERMRILTDRQTAELKKLNFEIDKILPSRLNVYNAQIENIRENTLNTYMENQLNKLGVQKGDNVGLRVLLQGLNKKYSKLFKSYGY